MSFLRSVIADARPCKPMREPSDGPSEITGWNPRGLDVDASDAEGKSSCIPDKTISLSRSLPIQEGASDSNIDDTPAFHVDHPVNQGSQDMGNNVESESPLAVPVDKFGPIPDEHSHARLDTGNLPDQEPKSEEEKAPNTERDMTQLADGTIMPTSRMNFPNGQDHDPSIASPETRGARNRAFNLEQTEPASSLTSIRGMPEKALSDNGGNSALQTEKGTGQLGEDETVSLPTEGNTPDQGEVNGATDTDDRRPSESSIIDPEAFAIKASAAQTITITPLESSRQIESSVPEASLMSTGYSPNALGNPTPDSFAERYEAEKALADEGKARQVSPNADKQGDMKSLSNQEDTVRLQKSSKSKGVFRNGQLVSSQTIAMDSLISSDVELTSDSKLASKEGSASISSPKSGPSKPGSPVQHISRPSRPATNPKALRFVSARPFQTDLGPEDGNSFHSKAALRYPEKKHEAPRVQIGQIDVIVEAAAQPASKPAPVSSPVDLASRHYLRRL